MEIIIQVIAFCAGIAIGFIIRDLMKGKNWKNNE